MINYGLLLKGIVHQKMKKKKKKMLGTPVLEKQRARGKTGPQKRVFMLYEVMGKECTFLASFKSSIRSCSPWDSSKMAWQKHDRKATTKERGTSMRDTKNHMHLADIVVIYPFISKFKSLKCTCDTEYQYFHCICNFCKKNIG